MPLIEQSYTPHEGVLVPIPAVYCAFVSCSSVPCWTQFIPSCLHPCLHPDVPCRAHTVDSSTRGDGAPDNRIWGNGCHARTQADRQSRKYRTTAEWTHADAHARSATRAFLPSMDPGQGVQLEEGLSQKKELEELAFEPVEVFTHRGPHASASSWIRITTAPSHYADISTRRSTYSSPSLTVSPNHLCAPMRACIR
eukprot:GHVU01069742.1.p1 GENE.GHVU01069742.1~~GHVU01069742.1.p1  ORF type:complete len:196 (+),score=1.02 GHVU01069742.1:663-1250(+)